MKLPERPLGDAIRLASTSVTVLPDEEYRIAGIYSFGRGLIKRPTIRGTETSYSTLTRLQSGQLAMSKLNAWEGAITLVPEEFSGAHVSPEYPVFDINEEIAEPSYIAHLASWPTLWDRLTPRGSMVRRKRTTPSALMGTIVPMPDLDEQRRIATRLDTAFAKVSEVEEAQACRTKLSSAFAESTISSALEQANTSAKVGDIMTLTRRPVSPNLNEDYREIGIRSFGRGVFHKEPLKGETLGNKRVFAIKPGDLLFSNVFAWEGAVALAGESEEGFIGSHRFMTYRVNETVADSSYLRHYFTCRHGLEVIRRASPGSAGRNRTLGIKNFESQLIPLPKLEIQQETGRRLDEISNGLSFASSADITNSLRPSLLNTAFDGRL
ncbi:restriction endonuclease subunit S [Spirillospora albida]|uniref:restriction endonuclease subunit S n=1 Tax=Spirillospora albida TaxID=58123 RepID=UPI000A057967|nr:restriction endonuclease subunit S [Spirillospora albida]